MAAAICIKFIHLEIFEVRLGRLAESCGLAGALRDCALVVPCTFFGLVITFRDRCRRSGVDERMSWQAPYFGRGRGLWRALFSWQVQ